MRSVFRFSQRYDVSRLDRDLRAAEAMGPGHVHYNMRDHDGGWSAIALVSTNGRTDAPALKALGGEYRKTPVLAACPYFEEIIESFQCHKERVRLMQLAPGTHIFPHADGPRFSWALGTIARMHIPIVTHDQVTFIVDGERVTMAPGELWYCDVSRPHEVSNRGSVGRVHLVIDLIMNSALRATFPAEPVWQQGLNFALKTRHRVLSRVQRLRTRAFGGL